MSKLAGLQFTMLNLGIDEVFAADVCQNLTYCDAYTQFEVFTATNMVYKATKKGKKNCDSEVAFLFDLILKKIPLNPYTVRVLQVTGQRALYGDLKSDYSKKRIALAEIFMEDSRAVICKNCLKNGTLTSAWEITKKGKLKCPNCKKREEFFRCDNCDFPIIQIKNQQFLSCRNCKKDIHLNTNKTTGGTLENPMQISLLLMSSIYKSDGRVSKDEVDQVVNYLKSLEFDSKQRKELLDFMKRNKNKYSFEDLLNKIEVIVSMDVELKIFFLRCGLFAASADKIYHPDEEKLILKLVRKLGIDNSVYNQIKKELFNNEVHDIAWCYEVLESNEGDSDSQIKIKYRALYKKYHPDKYESKELPDDIKKIIEGKAKEINFALEGLKKVRPKL